MKYLCLVYLDEKRLDEVPDEDCVAYDNAIRKSGHCLASEALQSVQTATTVRVRNGKVSITDGPFAETKEQLAGFYLIEAKRPERSDPDRREDSAGARGQRRSAADPADPGDGRSRAAAARRAFVKERLMAVRPEASNRQQAPRLARGAPRHGRAPCARDGRDPQGRVAVSRRRGAAKTWRADGPHFLGHIINHLVLDPRDGRTLLAAAKTGHLGPTVFRSTDLGRTWKEAARPPAFAKARGGREGPRGRSHVLAHAGPRRRAGRLVRGHLAAGTVPLRGRRRHVGAVLRRSTTIRSTASGWAPCRTARRTGRSCTRSSSIRAIPRTCISRMSGGGVHESLDGGRTWTPLVKGLEVVEGFDRSRRHVPRSALRPALPEQSGPAVSAEPLRHLPARPAVGRVGAHRQEHAEAGRRRRLSDGGASARRGHRLGVPDGRHQRLAAHQPGRQARGLCDAQRRQDAGSGSTPACPRSRRGGR